MGSWGEARKTPPGALGWAGAGLPAPYMIHEPMCSSESLLGPEHAPRPPWISQSKATQCVSATMNSHAASGWGVPRRWGAGSSLAWPPPGGRLSSSPFGTRSVVSAYPGDHDPASLKNKEEEGVQAGRSTVAVSLFLQSSSGLRQTHGGWELRGGSWDGRHPSPEAALGLPAPHLPWHEPILSSPWLGLRGQPWTVGQHWGSHRGRSHISPAGSSHRCLVPAVGLRPWFL